MVAAPALAATVGTKGTTTARATAPRSFFFILAMRDTLC